MDFVPFEDVHLPGILALCEDAGWQTMTSDPARTARALSASITVVALEAGTVAGFAQVLTDGAIDAYLANLLVAETHRGHGLGRALLGDAYSRSGAVRLDLLALEEAEPFYERLPHRRLAGFRTYPPRERAAT